MLKRKGSRALAWVMTFVLLLGMVVTPTYADDENTGSDTGETTTSTTGTDEEESTEAAAATGEEASETDATADYVATVKASDGTVTSYESFSDAVAAATSGSIVTLLQDTSGNGIIIGSIDGQYDFTIDFGGYTYTVNGSELAGSTNTKTQCFQLLKATGSLTMKNGTIIADNSNIRMMIQNYCDLTLDSMTLDATKGTNNVNYVLSNNCGDVTITGSTTITAKSTGVAFDVYYWPGGGYSEGVSVTIDSANVKITGTIEYGSDGTTAGTSGIATYASLTILAGTINSSIVTGNLNSDGDYNITITGGTYSSDSNVSEYVSASATTTKNEDGTITVSALTATDTDAVASITTDDTTVYYSSLQGAVNAAASGATVTMLQDISLSEQLSVGKTVTLDLNGYILTRETTNTTAYLIQVTADGALTVQDSSTDKTGEIKAGYYYNSDDGNYHYGYGILAYGDLTVTGTKITGGYYSICTYATDAKLTITNSTISGVNRTIMVVYSTDVSISGSTITASSGYGVIAFSGAQVEITGCTITGSTAGVYATNDNTSVTIDSSNINAGDNTENGTYGIMVYYEASVTVNSTDADNPTKISGGYAGIAVFGDGTNYTELTVNGGTIWGSTFGISTNGSSSNGNVKITITEGSIEGGGVGMYLPAVDSTTIISGDSTTIKGLASGIEIRAGSLYISGGTITSTAEYLSVNYNGSGTTVYGTGIAVSQHSTNDEVYVEITGGTVSGYYGIYEVNTYYNKNSSTVTIKIAEDTDSTVAITATGEDAEAVYSESMDSTSEYAYSGTSISISSGTYSTAPDLAYCADGYAPIANDDGTYTVNTAVAAVYDADGEYVSAYTELSTAYSATPSGGTLVLVDDIEAPASGNTLSVYKKMALDLNGHTLAGNSIAIYVSSDDADLTIKDSSETESAEGTGKVTNSGGSGVVRVMSGTVTIESGSFEATSGNVLRTSGTTAEIVVNGGTFKADSSNAINNGGGTITINGGEFTSSAATITLSTTTSGDNTIYPTKVEIKGGTFNSQIAYDYRFGHTTVDGYVGVITISGGKFYTESSSLWRVQSYLADGYTTTAVEGETNWYTVGEMAALLTYTTTEDGVTTNCTVGYANVQLAVDAVSSLSDASDIVVTMYADYAKRVSVSGGTFTLDLNGCTITTNTDDGIALLVSEGTLTVTDSSEDHSGTVTTLDTNTNGSALVRVKNSGVMVTLAGGNYKPGSNQGTINASDGATLTVTGGYFTADPTAYVDTDVYEIAENDEAETYTYLVGNIIVGKQIALNGVTTVMIYVDQTYGLTSATIDVNEYEAGDDGIGTGTVNDVECYVFSQGVYSYKMANDFVISLQLGGDYEGYEVNTSTSLRDCADALLNGSSSTLTDEQRSILIALLNYGAKAQTYFEYNADDLANSIVSETEKETYDTSLGNVTVETVAGYTSTQCSENTGDLATLKSFDLICGTDFTLVLKYSVDVDGYTLAVSGAGEAGEAYVSGCYVYIPLTAAELDETLTVTLSNDGSSYGVTTSGLAYVRTVLKNSSAADDKKNLAKAIYLYNQSFAATSTAEEE